MPRVRTGKESLEGNGAGHIIINVSSVEGCIRDMMAMCNDGRSCLIRDTPMPQYCPIRAVVATSFVLVAAFKRRATGYVGDSWKSALGQPESEPGQRWVFPIRQFMHCQKDRVFLVHARCPEGRTRQRRTLGPISQGFGGPDIRKVFLLIPEPKRCGRRWSECCAS